MPAQETLFAPPRVEVVRRPDGSQLARSPEPLGEYSRCVGEWLVQWAAQAPDTVWLAQREGTGWKCLTYGEALPQVMALAGWMLRTRLSQHRPLVLLSDNSIEHALLSVAAMHVGVPAVPVSPAYSLMSRDFGKLKAILASVRPGAIHAAPAGRYTAALGAVHALHDAVLVLDDLTAAPVLAGGQVCEYGDLLAHAGPPDEARRVTEANAGVGPDTIAKVLFTSGSTGMPKGVLNTHRMLCSGQQARLQLWPFLGATPPVIVDWLPWNHTFGGNHNFNLVLRNGGSLYIDGGKAAPGLFDKTLENLREISPTIYFNVPRGYGFLVTALRSDAALRQRFFQRLQVIFYAAAALPQHLWDELRDLSRASTGRDIPMVAAWGSTETAPLATDCHFQARRSGVIGLPVPGTEVKLVPAAGKLEIRVRGVNVMPGYWQAPAQTREAFDDEGFYRIGDAVRWLDEEHPEQGLVFDGRIAEDFKLTSGTWVNVGGLRLRVLEALAPVVQDVVLCGHDRDDVRLLVFVDAAACRRMAGLDAQAPLSEAIAARAVREAVADGLRELKKDATGSSTCAACALLMAEPPSIDAGEITDKGYINQRAVLDRRAQLVAALYQSPPPPQAVCL